ncbi:alkaline phosphatase [Methylophaga sp. OBS4]|uniref:alkaline phosphatase n=1 Tax=Methylophaga sp. OBS4 TaxID=2991935 RepID=UPI002257A7F3|nr:alkaline phosphatase [Methylophaga sp. OBS4]MCX4187105.1 alkaline phosphatase [Methylophaga sp. OBS4]
MNAQAERALPEHQVNNPWYNDAVAKMANKPVFDPNKKAKNIILFVGDGMGVSTITAARILDGQNKGLSGEESSLSFESFPFTGLSKTYNVDAQTPDSAGTMTAIISGVKTNAGIIGIDEDVERGKCETVKGNELVTALELAEIAGKSTGFVTTTRVTHATPAATYAKSAERNWEDISDMPKAAVKAGCEDIASQLIHFEANLQRRFPKASNINGIEVVMGGGRRHFLPKEREFNSPDAVSVTEGDRTDGRNLISEWQQIYSNGVYIYDQAGFDAVEPAKTDKLLALFNESHMHYEADRKNDKAGEPSLVEMTTKAIDILDNNENGYFLLVEAGRIDHAHHAGNAFNALTDTIELSNAVSAAVEQTKQEETLIVVTADHSHVFTMAGYPKRGNPILGKVVNVGEQEPAKANDGLPYTTLGYTNGQGYRNMGNETNADISYGFPADTGRKDLTDIDTEISGYHQEALVPLESETHGGEDVAIYATGPGAEKVIGVNEQNVIFHIINQAAELEKKAANALK